MRNRPRPLASSVPGQTPPSIQDRNNATCGALSGQEEAGCAPPAPRGYQGHNRPDATPDHAAESGGFPPAHMPRGAQVRAGMCARFQFQKSPPGQDSLLPPHPARWPAQPSTAFAGSTPPSPSLPGQATPTDCRVTWPSSSSRSRTPCARKASAPCASLFH